MRHALSPARRSCIVSAARPQSGEVSSRPDVSDGAADERIPASAPARRRGLISAPSALSCGVHAARVPVNALDESMTSTPLARGVACSRRGAARRRDGYPLTVCLVWLIVTTGVPLSGASQGSAPAETGGGEGGSSLEYVRTHLGPGPLDRWLPGWEGLKRRLRQDHGFDVSVVYAPIFQHGTQGGRHNRTFNQGLDLYARWEGLVDHPILGRGTLDIYAQHRKDDIISTTAAEFSDALGTTMLVNDADAEDFDGTFNSVSTLAWEQELIEGQLILFAGQFDPDGLFDENAFAGDDRLSFIAEPLSNNPVQPGLDPGLGITMGLNATGFWYIRGRVLDGNANGEYPDVESLGDDTWAYQAETALLSSFEGYGQGTYRVSYRWIDATRRAPSGKAVALSIDQEIGPKLGTFVRYSIGDGDRAGTKQFFSAGIVLTEAFGYDDDWLGLGIFWGDPSEDELREEYGLEAFWRLQLTRHLQLTPDLQLWRPSNDRDADLRAVFSIRMGIIF